MKRKELKRAAAGLMAVALCMGLTAFPVFAGGTEIGRSVTVVEDGGKGPSWGWMKREKAAAGAMEETWC